MERILIIDDDVELCDLVTRYLLRENLTAEAVHDGERGIERAAAGDHALIVLDVMLPGLNGFEVLRRLRALPGAAAAVPVIMLTARGDETDRIVGLEIGADDYLAKPFNPRELAARIRAIMRRARPLAPDAATTEPETLQAGDIEIDVGGRLVRRAGEAIELTGVEFELLLILVRYAGQVVTRQQLVESVLDRKLTPFDRSIDTHISNLRRKLGHQAPGAGGTTERIKTVRGVGYLYARPAAKPAGGGKR